MLRSLMTLIMMLAFLLPAVHAVAGARAKTVAAKPASQPEVKPVAAADVNYDDPNLAFAPDYAADSAITCPKTLKGRRLRECLLKNGLASGEEISEHQESLSQVPSTSYH